MPHLHLISYHLLCNCIVLILCIFIFITQQLPQARKKIKSRSQACIFNLTHIHCIVMFVVPIPNPFSTTSYYAVRTCKNFVTVLNSTLIKPTLLTVLQQWTDKFLTYFLPENQINQHNSSNNVQCILSAFYESLSSLKLKQISAV